MATETAPSIDKLQRRLLRAVGRAIDDFEMIDPGDRVLVGLSGGKDSYTLLVILQLLQRRAPVPFELVAANLDPGYPGYRPDTVRDFARECGVEIHLIDAPIKQLAHRHIAEGKPACPLCSRMRRGALYTLANRIGAGKLALGHHLDDALETLLLNLFHAGALRAMPPRLVREPGPTVIRPLCYALEQDIAAYARARAFPAIACASAQCGGDDQRRQVVKRMLADLASEYPDLRTQMRKALGNVHTEALFDRNLRSRDSP